jgi:hypothetical protein
VVLLAGLLLGASTPANGGTPASVNVTSNQGLFSAVVMHPRPVPVAQLHTWKVRLFDSTRRPVVGAQIKVTGDMPAHGHGLPTAPIAVGRGRGLYELQGMKFQMPGRWYVQLNIRAAGRSDRIRIRFGIVG